MEQDILYFAVENFFKNSAIEITFDSNEIISPGGNDGWITLKVKHDKKRFPFIVKKRITTSSLNSITSYTKASQDVVLIAEYIPQEVRNYLKENDTCYLDAAGNAYFSDRNGLYIYIETRSTTRASDADANRAFSKTGLKVVYQILVDSSIVNKPYRDIGKLSKVSIDTVGRVFKGLLRDKYMIQVTAKEYKLYDMQRLMHEWVTLFNKVLRPKLRQRRFRAKSGDFKSLMSLKGCLGGELAAECLSKHLIAESAILYIDKPFVEIARSLGLIPDKEGNVILIQKFWVDAQEPNSSLVHPILVYADLIDNPTPRNLETSKIILDEHIKMLV